MSGRAAFEVGIGVSAGAADGTLLARTARSAEELGFHWVGMGEHVMFHNPTPNALVGLAYVAGVTERIRLLSSVVLAPLYPAALLAKMAAVLAGLSGGRLELGVGVGGEYPPEFEACGVDPRTRGARVDETLSVLRALWTGETVDHDGRFWHVHGRIQPAPSTPPRIWVAGRRDAAVLRAARYGDVYLPYLVRPARLKEQIDTLAGAERRVAVVPYVFLHVDRDGDVARTDAAAWLARTYRQQADAFTELVVAGSVDDCVDRLAQMREWGCAGAHVVLVSPPDQWFDRAALVAQEIVPRLA